MADYAVISSRTPEGEPARCPLCASDVRIEPSQPWGDAVCPTCGTLLWFFGAPDETRLVTRERVKEILADQLGVSPQQIEWPRDIRLIDGIDSLDLVELIMELEEEFDA